MPACLARRVLAGCGHVCSPSVQRLLVPTSPVSPQTRRRARPVIPFPTLDHALRHGEAVSHALRPGRWCCGRGCPVGPAAPTGTPARARCGVGGVGGVRADGRSRLLFPSAPCRIRLRLATERPEIAEPEPEPVRCGLQPRGRGPPGPDAPPAPAPAAAESCTPSTPRPVDAAIPPAAPPRSLKTSAAPATMATPPTGPSAEMPADRPMPRDGREMPRRPRPSPPRPAAAGTPFRFRPRSAHGRVRFETGTP